MKEEQQEKAPWKKRIKVTGMTLAVLGLILLFYCLLLAYQIDRRFSGRRWSIPSRVFSDTTLLYPGLTVNRETFLAKLHNLGYREIRPASARGGEMKSLRSEMELFLHDLKTPTQQRKGFPVRIRFWKDTIDSIIRLDTGESLPILELEPEEIMLFFGPEREQRELVSILQVPQHLLYAVLAAEDKRFYQHHGVDPRGIVRALYTNIRHQEIRQGGSTITQQLAKCYFLTPKRTVSRKLKELFMSLIIEIMYEKNEILEIYLNEIYLGQKGSVSINGVAEASRFYFGKSVSELSLADAATLAGLIKAPNYYSPYVDEESSRVHRDAVLGIMRKSGWISEEELTTTLAMPVSTIGYKTYIKKAPYFVDYLSEQLTELYSPEALSSLGLSIYTTLDTQAQMAAEKALKKGLARLEESFPELAREEPEKKLQGALIVMQPKTGYILAMVGGRDYSVSQFNRCSQARRQPGSAFKPFVFLSALDKFAPNYPLSNEPRTYLVNGEEWEPRNFKPVPETHVSMRKALVESINIPTVDLAMQVGLDRIVETASMFHFSTPLRPYPALSLGAFEVIPIELARAYCAFAADGVLPYALSLKEVVDENGIVLERRHMTIERVMSPAKAFMMTSLLESVVTEGTASSLKDMGIVFPVAGKTGTTNDSRDAWFVGYTPDILALIWVGFDNEESIHSTGSVIALPIWAELMNSLPQHVSGNWFRVPAGVVKKRICSDSGQLAVLFGCPNTHKEFFLEENVPTTQCPLHGSGDSIREMLEEGKKIIENM